MEGVLQKNFWRYFFPTGYREKAWFGYENGVWPPASPFRSPRGRFQDLLQDEAEQPKLPLSFFILSNLGM